MATYRDVLNRLQDYMQYVESPAFGAAGRREMEFAGKRAMGKTLQQRVSGGLPLGASFDEAEILQGTYAPYLADIERQRVSAQEFTLGQIANLTVAERESALRQYSVQAGISLDEARLALQKVQMSEEQRRYQLGEHRYDIEQRELRERWGKEFELAQYQAQTGRIAANQRQAAPPRNIWDIKTFDPMALPPTYMASRQYLGRTEQEPVKKQQT